MPWLPESIHSFIHSTENIEFLLQKKFYGAEILYGPRHLNCGGKIDKINKKKYIGKKSHAEDRTQILTKLTVFSNFLDTLKNWCKTTTGSEWYVTLFYHNLSPFSINFGLENLIKI
jgi:hypothetical protein